MWDKDRPGTTYQMDVKALYGEIEISQCLS